MKMAENDQFDTTGHNVDNEIIMQDHIFTLGLGEPVEGEKFERLLKLPLTRIKSIIKLDPDVTLVSNDAVVLIAKATVSYLRFINLYL